ncbi:MAG: peptidylprolyl isomerase [Proteobacteria bacterium]|nr:peptidylprolyl isomerase [Pseudomonadota bacterium]
MLIADRAVALFHYTLTDPAGAVIDASPAGQPLAYLHGAGNIVPGLEQAMQGRSAGDRFDVIVSPEQGYGERDPGLVQVVPRAAFQGVDSIEPGMQFQAQGGHGPMLVTVAAVDADSVTVDGNHPLAGVPLHFAVEIAQVREATAEELAHGHVHGAGGHHH